ncbi:YfcL family protein [Vibrio cincinnatiensis]|uniref:YfcL family protein n=1 Tax=Vibrio cincinnatiensis TaxID=675 RepID=UPI0012ACCE81|nr:YfcL family protein [Vibrio cincinnatiensis]MCG3760096.1 YfcL family protein [Vibrio cincinnatiensis]MCG3762286.1 YfcL family protein [Vibrio cincinnatiensis]
MIIEFEEKWLNLIDTRIESASDDELFAGGYLRGHISLSAAACEDEGIDDLTEFKTRIEQSLTAARSELSPADRAIVIELWQQLVAQV